MYLSPASGCQKFEACSLNTYVNKVRPFPQSNQPNNPQITRMPHFLYLIPRYNRHYQVSDALPASTSITLGVFMAFVALVLLGVGFLIGCVPTCI